MPEPTLKQLKCKKTNLKRSLTRCTAYLNAFTDGTVSELKERYEKLEPLLRQFEDIQSQIQIITDESEIQEDVDYEMKSVEFENSYFKLLGRLKDMMHSNAKNDTSKINNDPSQDQLSNHIKLPTIKLPTFSGKYIDWFPFYDTFNSLIHNSPSLADIQKFHYLRSSLQGEAANVIDSLEISTENYIEAWEMLKSRYDNKRLIVQNHIRAIHELPVALKENQSGLRAILDGVLKHIRALKALHRPTDYWDDLIIYIITGKLDSTTKREWENKLNSTELPTFQELTDFLAHKCQTLEALCKELQPREVFHKERPTHGKRVLSANISAVKSLCQICNSNHPIYRCKTFLDLPINERILKVKVNRLCLNCLKPNHFSSECSASSCQKCHKKHNTLLHVEQILNSASSTSSNHISSIHTVSQVLLSTAVIDVYDSKGKRHSCRALLDSGSQSNFITRKLSRKLGLSTNSFQLPVSGINQSTVSVSQSVQTRIQSRYNAFKANIKYLVLDNITGRLPAVSIETSEIFIPKAIKLADPHFNISSDIDLLIGAELFCQLLCVGQIKTSASQPYLQKTHFGWVISGKFTSNKTINSTSSCHLSLNLTHLDESLRRFWELESYSNKSNLSVEEQACEKHFLQTHSRTQEGRFVVSLPLKGDKTILGDSKELALKRFWSLERKLSKNTEMKAQYTAFMEEYLSLGHMEEVSETQQINPSPSFYLPHHGVIKESSLTTKLRVVFDGSCKSTAGTSLNDLLMVGPKMQQDLFSIVVRFRTFKFVLTADIAKMYRQVLVRKEDRPLQRILWRSNEQEEVKTFELTTVTYGTASASYLATRALQQVAHDKASVFPIGSKIILRDFYVDDLLTGANTKEEIENIRTQVVIILNTAGFELRKWCSNSSDLLKDISSASDSSILNISKDDSIKTLGLMWNSATDVLQYSNFSHASSKRATKRVILSEISKIFDPLGLIGPVLITAKILMQGLWTLKIDWDESVPIEIYTTWTQYVRELQHIHNIKIPRYTIECEHQRQLEIHGFCDASERAYGACIYIRSIDNDNTIKCNLLCAKSRVAPLKSISLPRLELCGALLLSQLAHSVIESLPHKINDVYYWTDSTIVLSWISSPSRNWKTFVSNRIGEIHELTNPSQWKHISTHENPADIISRGMSPSLLAMSDLWWKGPDCLRKQPSHWPELIYISHPSTMPEQRVAITFVSAMEPSWDIFDKYSDFRKLIRITAYCLRFKNNISARLHGNHEMIHTGPLNSNELVSATIGLVKHVQGYSFCDDINHLQRHGFASSNSRLLSLSPFLDNGIIRVGGLLRNSNLSYSQKHQMLLPSRHPFTKLLSRHEHNKRLHSGLQATVAAIQCKYWIIAIRSTVRSVIQKCITCFRARPSSIEYIMGDLPSSRSRPSRPFENVGVDYFGPLYLREGVRKNKRLTKAYGAVFVCFATRAVHAELVTDMTCEAFIGALKRFMGRRGKPANVHSDNGTQFVAANKELKQLREQFQSQFHEERFINVIASEGITWHFIPPRSPHFGGIWEAAVKSFKHHLNRVLTNTSLNFEEMYTLLVQIEGILNSCPLTPLSSDPNDFSYLTPAHFLIGDSIETIAEPSMSHLKVNSLSRWQYLQQLREHFWRRWHKDYLNQFQSRNKWKVNQGTQLRPGLLVVLRDEQLPPMQWAMGRVEEVHPGVDEVIRAATIRTARGVTRRATAKLCILPTEID